MSEIAIIGTGSIAHAHARAFQELDKPIIAAVDIDPDRAKQFCAAYNIPHAYTSSSDLLAHHQPDVVSICTPPATHTDLIIEAMEAGAWVYCEKPICASLAELDRIYEAEKRTGQRVASVFQVRFGSGAIHLRDLMQKGELGRVLVGVCQTLWYRGQDYYDVSWRGKWETEVGGTTVIHGIHEIDLALSLLGDWREVRAMMGTLDRSIEVDDVLMAIVQFENNAMLNITNSALSPREETYLRLDFQRATVELRHHYGYENHQWQYSIGANSPDAELLSRWQTIPEDYAADWTSQLRHFFRVLETGEQPPVGGDDLRHTMELITALYKASITGEPVLRGSITPDDPFYYAVNGQPR